MMVYDIAKGEFPPDGILRDGDTITNIAYQGMSFSNVPQPPEVFTFPPPVVPEHITLTTVFVPGKNSK